MTQPPVPPPPQPDDEMVATLVHELRNPLASARGLVEMLNIVGTLNERQQHFVERTTNVLTKMEGLVNTLLDAFRATHADVPRAACALDVVVNDVLTTLAEVAAQHQVTLVSHVPPDLPWVFGDARRLYLMVLNLVTNGVKYNRPGGLVIVRAVPDANEDAVRLTVEDTGVGIAALDLPNIFRRFYRGQQGGQGTHVEGTGLGLAIVAGIVDQHGGRVSVDSVLEVGTTFTVTLPTAPPAPTTPITDSAREGAPPHADAEEWPDGQPDNLQETHHVTRDERPDTAPPVA